MCEKIDHLMMKQNEISTIDRTQAKRGWGLWLWWRCTCGEYSVRGGELGEKKERKKKFDGRRRSDRSDKGARFCYAEMWKTGQERLHFAPGGSWKEFKDGSDNQTMLQWCLRSNKSTLTHSQTLSRKNSQNTNVTWKLVQSSFFTQWWKRNSVRVL